jgi:chromosome partitioning protein
MTIVTIANQKGGVGKTTTSVTMGHGLAMMGLRTLIVDLDPQGHVAFCLGVEKTPGLYQLIVDERPIEEVVIHCRENLDIVPGDKCTEKAKRAVVISNYPTEILKRTLEPAKYDVILLDMAPSLDVLHLAALMASDWVLIPTKLDAMAMDGVNEILRSMGEVVERGVRLGYNILPTFFERTTRETIVQLRALVEAFKERVWPPIPQDTKAREATAFGKTLWEYCPSSPVVVGFGEKRIGGYGSTLLRLKEVLNVETVEAA